jgi:glycosyltransferase involved in cell wall biosynthesis
MRVLQICPLWFPIARDAAGGIETVAPHLIDALIAQQCEVTLLAAGDSQTRARLQPAIERGVTRAMASGLASQYEYYEQHQLALALEHAADFDIVHSHVGASAFVLSAWPELRDRVLHTLHAPVYADMAWFGGRHPELWLSTVSEYQARALRSHGGERCRVIHNGLEFARFDLQPERREDLLFIGRIERAKGPELAVRVARRLHRRLRLCGPILDRDLFAREIEPFLDRRIEYLGVVDHARKNTLFGQAGCVILPFGGAEPFGMVAIEAMACGTPVVALGNGALPEIVEPGVTGYLARSESELDGLIPRALLLNRAAIRARAKQRFDIAAVATRYIELYRHMLREQRSPRAASAGERAHA